MPCDAQLQPASFRSTSSMFLKACSNVGEIPERIRGTANVSAKNDLNTTLEGLVSKRRDRPYQAARSKRWVKVKNRKHPAMSRVMKSV